MTDNAVCFLFLQYNCNKMSYLSEFLVDYDKISVYFHDFLESERCVSTETILRVLKR